MIVRMLQRDQHSDEGVSCRRALTIIDIIRPRDIIWDLATTREGIDGPQRTSKGIIRERIVRVAWMAKTVSWIFLGCLKLSTLIVQLSGHKSMNCFVGFLE